MRRLCQRVVHRQITCHLAGPVVAASLLVVLLWAPLSHTQSKNSRPLARISFDFFVGSQQLPAGKYQLEFTTASMFRLHNLDNQASARAFTLPEGPPLETKGAKLVFFLHDGKYVLAGLASASGKQRLSMYYGMSPGKHDVRVDVPLEFP